MTLLNKTDAQAWADAWVQAWNNHDIEAVLAHFTEDVEFCSPMVVQVCGHQNGIVKGKAALREYWRQALERVPNLHFELVDVLVSLHGLIIIYRGHRGLTAEVLHLNEQGQAVRGQAFYPV